MGINSNPKTTVVVVNAKAWKANKSATYKIAVSQAVMRDREMSRVLIFFCLVKKNIAHKIPSGDAMKKSITDVIIK